MMGWNMGWGGGMFFGGFLSLLILVAVVVLAVGLLRNTGGNDITPSSYGERRASYDEPLRILQTRYANGEINQEEYETKRRDLETASGSGSQVR